MSFKNPFVYNIPSAEVFGRVSSINDYYVELPKTEDRAAYWTKNTVLPSGNIFYLNNIPSGNTWLKIIDQNLVTNNTTIYGLPANSIITGDINYYMENCTFKNLSICGPSVNSTIPIQVDGNINITFKNCTCTGTGILGFNPGNMNIINCNIINCNTSGENMLATLYKNAINTSLSVISEINTMNINIKDTILNENKRLFIGMMAQTRTELSQPSDTNYCHIKHLNITLTNCEKHGLSNSYHPIYCGGYATDTYNTNNKPSMYIDNLNIVINSGRYFYYNEGESGINGTGIYLGTWSSNKGISIIGNINCEVNDGEIYNLYCGPHVQNDGVGIVTGDTNVYINAGKIGSLLGMGGRTTGSGTQHVITSGTIYLHINGGEIGIVCPAMRHADSDTVNGDGTESCQDSYVILSGNHNHFDTEFRACSLHNDDAFRQSNLVFENYTGILSSCAIIGFENIEVKKNSCVIISSAIYNAYHNNGPVKLDLTQRSIDYAISSCLSNTLEGLNPEPETILSDNTFNLYLNDTNSLVSYKLFTNIGNTIPEFIHLSNNNISFNIYYNNQLIKSFADVSNWYSTPTYHYTIENTGTIFDGYYLSLTDNNYTIMLCKPE